MRGEELILTGKKIISLRNYCIFFRQPMDFLSFVHMGAHQYAAALRHSFGGPESRENS